MDGFEQRATVIRNGFYATITVSVTTPCENKVRRVGCPHVSQLLLLQRKEWPVETRKDKADNDISMDK